MLGDADLPDWAEYYADSGVCLIAHNALWPGVLMVHLGVVPSAWGRTEKPINRLLREIWREHEPDRLIAWVAESNRAVVSLLTRLGWQRDGGFPGVLMYGWRL